MLQPTPTLDSQQGKTEKEGLHCDLERDAAELEEPGGEPGDGKDRQAD